jgi:hypothetical protein
MADQDFYVTFTLGVRDMFDGRAKTHVLARRSIKPNTRVTTVLCGRDVTDPIASPWDEEPAGVRCASCTGLLAAQRAKASSSWSVAR